MEHTPSGRARQIGNAIWPQYLQPVSIILAYKLLIALCAIVALKWGNFDFYQWGSVIHWPDQSEPTVISRFGTWDSAHYLSLAVRGYRAGSPSCAFYPALPWVLSVFKSNADGMVIWGLVLCNICSAIGLLMAFIVFELIISDRKRSIHALILLICYPGSMFLNVIYTEPLFLLQSTALIWGCLTRRAVVVAVAAICISLTQAVGFYGVVCLCSAMIVWRHPKRLVIVAGISATVGYTIYFLFMWLSTGNPFEGFAAQKNFPTAPSIANAFNLAILMDAWFTNLSFHGMSNSFLDRFFFIVFMIAIVSECRSKSPWIFFAIPVGLIPALTALWISYMRGLVGCWLLFPRIALWTSGNAAAFWCLSATCLCVQIWLFYRHLNFQWAN